jgi:hypothetical protein
MLCAPPGNGRNNDGGASGSKEMYIKIDGVTVYMLSHRHLAMTTLVWK